MAKEIVDLTETFTDLRDNIHELYEGAHTRSEAIKNLLSLVLSAFEDKQSIVSVAENNDLRVEIKGHISNMIGLINSHDPNYLKKFTFLESICTISIKQIDLVKKEGAEIV